MSIISIHAREIFDSRGNPTVEVDLCTDKGKQLNLTMVPLVGAGSNTMNEIKVIVGENDPECPLAGHCVRVCACMRI